MLTRINLVNQHPLTAICLAYFDGSSNHIGPVEITCSNTIKLCLHQLLSAENMLITLMLINTHLKHRQLNSCMANCLCRERLFTLLQTILTTHCISTKTEIQGFCHIKQNELFKGNQPAAESMTSENADTRFETIVCLSVRSLVLLLILVPLSLSIQYM